MSKHPVLDLIAQKSPHLSWIQDNTALLVRHGSHAYGTNTPASDEDFKGIAIPPKKYFLGTMHRFEQAELKAPDPDAVIYDIRKFFNLAADCNPNIIEVLHTDPSDHFLVTPIGQEILDHKDDFLSKKIKFTFMGYSVAQLKRIKTHKRWIMNPPKEVPTRASLGLPEQTLIPADQLMAATAEVQKELDRFQFDFMEGLEESTKISIRGTVHEMLAELKITTDQHWEAAARKIGLSDNLILVMQREREYAGAKREWDQYQNWKKTRNPVRSALEEKYGYDTKHAYHLVRLIRMCREILTTGKVLVKRPDREELLTIRNGAWSYEQLIEFADREEKELNDLYLTSTALPKMPNKEKLDELCIRLVELSLSGK
jgi:predicted nucleotidyltransferase